MSQRLLESTLAVFFVGWLAPVVAAQPHRPPDPPSAKRRLVDWPPIGSLDSPRLGESSGVVKSRKYADIFWTHNDSGNPPVLFAFRLTGEVIAEIRVAGAKNVDWEDIAINDAGKLYIGDIGDNVGLRTMYQIYELLEPDPFATPSKPVRVTRTYRYRFPEGQLDCEALFVYRDKLHIVTKKARERPILYRLEPEDDGRLMPTRVCTVPLAPITAADVSPDGRRLALCSYGQVAVFPIAGDLSKISEADPKRVSFPMILQTEACCFDGGDVIVTAESREIWRISSADIEMQRRFVGR